ncbi:conserved hypothetical protein [Anaeromyxobacter dehalogenans 2CP-1]|uniref:Lipoprotein n=2 Tax=Anaeromyxobacter dehalogenans TaxID=161493 RepID=B8J7P2_ANAD2|nr:conserved hypothetical protein [Anaeromyxobacter dehalogenans 2CP-1]
MGFTNRRMPTGTLMRKLTIAALCAAAMACGGDDKAADPASRKFTYGAAGAATFEEQAAADLAQGSAADAQLVQSGTSSDGSSVAGLADAMASQAWGSATVAVTALRAAGIERAVTTVRPAADLTGFDDPTCVTVTAGRISYSGCTITVGLDQLSVNGWFARDGATLAWDVTSALHSVADGYDLDVSAHLTGNLTFGTGTIIGRVRSDNAATIHTAQASMHVAYATLADLDLEHDGNGCVTGGTLELRRVWTDRAPGMPTTGEYADAGLLFSWQGCGVVLVSRSL